MEPDVKSLSLNWEVFVTPGIPVASSDVLLGQKQRTYSPISSTLIYGKHDGVLVDTLLTVEKSNDLANWIAARGKNLTTIYKAMEVYKQHNKEEIFLSLATRLQADSTTCNLNLVI